MQNNFKLLIVQKFDPDTDYSSYDEAELDGAFEATVYDLLTRQQSPGFTENIVIPEKGDAVQWKYGKGLGSGKVTRIYSEPITLKLGESDITRNGTEENPALLISQPNGSQVLKLASEVRIIREIELDEPVIAYSFDFGGKYDHIDLTPTKGMIKAAKQAQEYIKQGFAGDGMERETIRWVNLVAQGKPLSLEKAKKGYKFFQRHNYYKKTKNTGDTNPNNPAPWYVARVAWFGDDGESFFNRVWRQIKAVDNSVDNSENMQSDSLDFGSIIHKVIKWNGLDIGCEYKPGEVRFPGRRNSRKLRCGYGHIRGYRDNTGEAPDVYLAPEFFNGGTPSDRLFKVAQLSPEDGDFDEPKYMCGFSDKETAKQAYLREMPQDYFGDIEEVFINDLAKYKKTMDFTEIRQEISDRFLQLEQAINTQHISNFDESVSNLASSIQTGLATSNQNYLELKTELTQVKELLTNKLTILDYSDLTATVNSSKQDTDDRLSKLQAEIAELKTVISSTQSDNEKLHNMSTKLDDISEKILEFVTPIKLKGDILSKEDIEQFAIVDNSTVQAAVGNWQENVSEYNNLLTTGESKDDNTATI